MPRLPRLALGTLAPSFGPVAAVWALLAALRTRDHSVQPFLAQACFQPQFGGAALSGRLPRHLDSWLMGESVCRELFAHGASGCDLALVLGSFEPTTAATLSDGGSSFAALGRWLDLPQIAALDIATLNDCALPSRPAAVDGVLLYGDGTAETFERHRTQMETLWGTPALGAVAIPESLSAALSALPAGAPLSGELTKSLAACADRSVAWDRLWSLAGRRPLPAAPVQLFAPREARLGGVRLAIAYDDALCCYFPDVLELLELRGATVRDFSPLRDDRLPDGTDVVYLGCGHPEQFAQQLAENDCLKLALREHAVAGRRIYAEGGAAAMLAETLVTSDGVGHAMAGLLPLTLRPSASCEHSPRPTETKLIRDCWLGPAGTVIRGYLSPRWTFDGPATVDALSLTDDPAPVLLGRGETIVSRLHLNFAALPGALEGLLAVPPRAALAWV